MKPTLPQHLPMIPNTARDSSPNTQSQSANTPQGTPLPSTKPLSSRQIPPDHDHQSPAITNHPFATTAHLAESQRVPKPATVDTTPTASMMRITHPAERIQDTIPSLPTTSGDSKGAGRLTT